MLLSQISNTDCLSAALVNVLAGVVAELRICIINEDINELKGQETLNTNVLSINDFNQRPESSLSLSVCVCVCSHHLIKSLMKQKHLTRVPSAQIPLYPIS